MDFGGLMSQIIAKVLNQTWSLNMEPEVMMAGSKELINDYQSHKCYDNRLDYTELNIDRIANVAINCILTHQVSLSEKEIELTCHSSANG